MNKRKIKLSILVKGNMPCEKDRQKIRYALRAVSKPEGFQLGAIKFEERKKLKADFALKLYAEIGGANFLIYENEPGVITNCYMYGRNKVDWVRPSEISEKLLALFKRLRNL